MFLIFLNQQVIHPELCENEVRDFFKYLYEKNSIRYPYASRFQRMQQPNFFAASQSGTPSV